MIQNDIPDPKGYDGRVPLTIPGYEEIHKRIADTVGSLDERPRYWLDTGCGTGTLVAGNVDRFPDTEFILADPSSGMQDAARSKLSGKQNCSFVEKGTEDVNFGNGTLDVITAVLCHGYYDREGRRKATENCYRLLREGGLYFTVEHIRQDTDEETDAAMGRWRKFLIEGGRTPEETDAYLDRRDTVFFPITVREHTDLLKECGFREVNVFWRSCSDAGFLASK
ncbi:MAG: methyltransferase domain-containing protein [Candidatus Methanomethylophilaceae archaeon]